MLVTKSDKDTKRKENYRLYPSEIWMQNLLIGI